MNRAALASTTDATAEDIVTSPSVVMLTNDRQKFDRRVLLQADSLEAAGWNVTIVGLPLDPGNEETDPRAVRVSTASPAAAHEARILPIYRRLRRWLAADAYLMRIIRDLGWRFIADQETFYTNLYEKTLSQYMPDVVVAHDLPMLPVGYHAAKRCGAKLVYDSHELYSEQEFTGWEKRRWDEIEAKYIGHCDRVIAINPAMAAEFKQRYGVNNIDIIYNAERLIDIPERQKLFHKIFNLPAESKILLYQGGLSANRHIEVLVSCMRHVRDANIHLVVLGDGPLRKKLEKIAARNRMTHRVHFHDAVPQKDLLSYTASADAGVIPYQATCLNNYLCTPNKMFEFIAAGLPIVANDLPEMRKFIAGYDIGLLGNMTTAEKFADLIDDFFRDTSRLEKWRAQAKEARTTVCWEQEEKKVITIYKDLI